MIYKINPQIGTSKYSVSYYDGESTNRDGSPRWSMATFRSRRALYTFTERLRSMGYKEA